MELISLIYKSRKLQAPLWALVGVLISILILFPLLPTILQWFNPGDGVWSHVVENLLEQYIFNSLILSIFTALITFIIGVIPAWYISQYRFPGRQFFKWALVLPLAIPVYIMAYLYADLTQFGGWLNFLSIDLLNKPGLIFVYSLALFPYVYVSALVAFGHNSADYAESAISLGSNRLSVFRRVALPMARPFIAGGMFLVIMEVLNDYGAVKYFGVPTFTYGIFRTWFSLESLDAALRLAGILLVCIGLFYFLEKQYQRRSYYAESPIQREKQLLKLPPNKALTCTLLLGILLFAAFVLPLLKMLLNTFLQFETDFNLNVVSATLNTIWLSGLVSVIVVISALLLSYSERINRHIIANISLKIGSLGYAIPGAILAIGGLAVIYSFRGAAAIMAGSAFFLIILLAVRFMAIGLQPISSAFDKVPKEMDETASSFGFRRFYILLKLIIPNIKPVILAAWILAFIDVSKELPLTLILRPFNFDTLATKTFELANDEMLRESSFPALLVVIISTLGILIVNKYFINQFPALK